MRVPQVSAMKVSYFKDTDTALLEFSDRPIQETQAVNENIYLDLDADGNLVSITLEHATHTTTLPEVVVQQFDHEAASAGEWRGALKDSEQIHATLADSVDLSDFCERTCQIAATTSNTVQTDSVALLREDRER